MEKYVVSKDLAQKLKDVGYAKKSTIFVWWRLPDRKRKATQVWFLGQRSPMMDIPPYQTIAAPMSDELLERLPGHIESHGQLELIAWNNNSWRCGYYRAGAKAPVFNVCKDADKPVDALAKLWLWCKENGRTPSNVTSESEKE